MTQPKFAQSTQDLIQPDIAKTISGLEFMQSVLSGQFPAPPISKTLGFALHSVQDGRVAFTGAAVFDYLNPMGGVHGGWYGTVLDSAMGCAVMTKVPKGSYYTTLEYKVNIVRALPLGRDIIATGEVEHAGRTTAVATARMVDRENGRLYATANTTCIIMKFPD